MRRTLAILCTVAALWPSCAGAVTLDNVFRRALESDPVLSSADYLRLASKGDKDASCGRLWPQITVPGSYTTYNQDGAGTVLGQDASNTSGEIEGQQAAIGIALNQTLFDMEQFAACRAARVEVDRGNARYEMELENLIERVVRAYIGVLTARDHANTAQSALALHRALLNEAEKGYKTKTGSRLDLETAQERFKIAEADSTVAETALDIAERRLEDLSGTDVTADNLAALKDDPALPFPEPPDPAYWEDMAEKGNLQMIESALGVEVAHYGVKAAYGDMLPTVSLFAAHTRYDNDINRTGAPLPSDNDTFDTEAAGVRMSWPLFAGGSKKGAASAAGNRYKAEQRQHEALRRAIRLDARRALSNLNDFRAAIEAAKAGEQAARTAEKSAKDGRKAGTAREADVLDARKTLVQAQEKYNAAHYDYVLGMVTFWKSIGALSATSIDEIGSWLAENE